MNNSEIEKPDLNTSLINISLAYTAGFITRKLIVGNSKNIIRQLTGVVAEVLIANMVFNNAELLKHKSSDLRNRVLKYNK